MKILIKGEGHSITLAVPTALVFNRISVSLWLKMIRKHSAQGAPYLPEHAEEKAEKLFAKLPEETVGKIASELMGAKKRYGTWTLVEVESAGGEQVLITL